MVALDSKECCNQVMLIGKKAEIGVVLEIKEKDEKELIEAKSGNSSRKRRGNKKKTKQKKKEKKRKKKKKKKQKKKKK